jgi:hypothetical protein
LIPEYIDPEAWYGFVRMRKAKGSRAPFTEDAERLSLRKLEDFYRQGYDVNHILEESVMNGWSGLFIKSDTPRRQMNQQDKANQARVMNLVSKAIK